MVTNFVANDGTNASSLLLEEKQRNGVITVVHVVRVFELLQNRKVAAKGGSFAVFVPECHRQEVWATPCTLHPVGVEAVIQKKGTDTFQAVTGWLLQVASEANTDRKKPVDMVFSRGSSMLARTCARRLLCILENK